MRKLVHPGMGEFPGQRLGDGQRCKIAVGQEHGRFRAEKSSKFTFQLRVDLVIPRRQARGGDVQTVFFSDETAAMAS